MRNCPPTLRSVPSRLQPMGGIKNDSMSQNEYDNFLYLSFGNMLNNLNDGGSFYLCCNYPSDVDYTNTLRKYDVNISCSIIWDKGAMILDRKDYHACKSLFR